MNHKMMVSFSLAAALNGFAADVLFTGASASNPLDLSDAANWSAAPGMSVRGVIDFKRITTTSNFVLSADLELAHLVLSNNVAGVVTISSENGSTLTLQNGAFIYNTGSSPLRFLSGTIASGTGIGIVEGMVEVAGGTLSAVNGELTLPSDDKAQRTAIGLAISSGTVEARHIRPGVRPPMFQSVAPDIRQTGGQVTASSTLEIGRTRKSAIAVNGSNPGDYLLDGGTLTANKLILARQENAAAAVDGQFGRYVQRGGEATMGAVNFGSTYADTRSFGQFELLGGTFNLGAGGFASGKAFDSSLGYRFRQAGGTVKATDDFAVDFAYDVERGEAASTWNTDGHNVTFRGPVRGEGTLVKAGEGSLILKDAHGLIGLLSVQEGCVRVAGAVSEPVISGYNRYLRFTAADIDTSSAAAQCDGTALTNWVSTTGTGAATYTGWAQTNSTPTVVSADGRQWVYFNQSALEIPAAQNPVAGETNFLVALVFKTTTTGSGSGSGWWNTSGVLGNEQSGYPADWGLAFGSGGKFSCGAGGVGKTDAGQLWLETANATSLADGRTHVLLVAYSGNALQMVVDGIYAAKALSENVVENIPARQELPCYVGAHNPAAAKFKTYSWKDGYMAELRIYGGKTFSRSEIEALGRCLSAQYQAPVQNWNEEHAQEAEVEFAFDEKPAAPALPVHSADWSADTLADTLVDGDEVEDWASVDGTRHATKSAATIRYWRPKDVASQGAETAGDSPTAPVFVAEAVNGHAAVRFGGKSSLRTMLAVPDAESPISGKMNYTVAAVIATTHEPDNSSSWAQQGQWMTTLLSTGNGMRKDTGGGYDCYNTNSFFFGLIPGGGVHATTTKSAAGSYEYVYPCGPMRLNDGNPHCLVFAHDRQTGERRVMIDGYLQTATGGTRFSDEATMISERVLLGVVDAANKFKSADFQGDIAAFRLYGEALDADGMKALSDGWCAKYGILPIDGRSYAAAAPERHGLGVTNVSVAAGATLALPTTAGRPFTVNAGDSFMCHGAWKGTVRFAAGAVADFAAAKPETAGEVRLAAGSQVTFDYAAGAIAAERVIIEGDVAIAFEGMGTLAQTGAVFTAADKVTIAPGAKISVSGKAASCALSDDGKSLQFHRFRGMTVSFR